MDTIPRTTTPPSGPTGTRVENAVQRVADVSVWLLFRLTGVRS